MDKDKIIEELKAEIEILKKRIEELTRKIGGRPKRFTEAEKELIKMYRWQGKSMKELATLFNCSVGMIHKVVSEKKNN